MRLCSYLVLPTFLISSLIFYYLNLLEVGLVEIKGYELKHTELNYEWYYRDGDVFTSSQTVSSLYYEDAVLAFKPDFEKLLDNHLKIIANKREIINEIYGKDLTLFTDNYALKICLEDANVYQVDSSWLKTLVTMDILGQVELYDRDKCTLLYSEPLQKFSLNNKLLITGFASNEFLDMKMKELVISQIANQVKGYIRRYEEPHNYYPWRRQRWARANHDTNNHINRAKLD